MTRDLAHWDVIEALEEVCVYKVFEVYGVTDHHDKHRLKVQVLEKTITFKNKNKLG